MLEAECLQGNISKGENLQVNIQKGKQPILGRRGRLVKYSFLPRSQNWIIIVTVNMPDFCESRKLISLFLLFYQKNPSYGIVYFLRTVLVSHNFEFCISSISFFFFLQDHGGIKVLFLFFPKDGFSEKALLIVLKFLRANFELFFLEFFKQMSNEKNFL